MDQNTKSRSFYAYNYYISSFQISRIKILKKKKISYYLSNNLDKN